MVTVRHMTDMMMKYELYDINSILTWVLSAYVYVITDYKKVLIPL
jgi:hypothetical protein